MSTPSAQFLMALAPAGTGQITAALRPAYLKAAARLSSDYERRRAMTAIGERE